VFYDCVSVWSPRPSHTLRTLLAHDRAVEEWLRETVAPAYDALKADPSRAISAGHVRFVLSNAHKKALAKKG
jgi:antitoxin ParD1/3/4